MPTTATQMVEDKAEPSPECGCDAPNRELDEALRESASISSEPIRSGIGVMDFFEMVRKGVESRVIEKNAGKLSEQQTASPAESQRK